MRMLFQRNEKGTAGNTPEKNDVIENADGGDAKLWIGQAEEMIRKEQYEEAVETLQKVLAEEPENGGAYQALGMIAAMEGNLELARNRFGKAISLGHVTVKLLLSMAMVERADGNEKEYKRLLLQAMEMDEVHAAPMQLLFAEAIERSDYAEALKYANRVLKKRPELYDGYHMAVSILLQTKKTAEACELLEKAEAYFSTMPEYVCDYALALTRNGREKEAYDYISGRKGYLDVNSYSYLRVMAEIAVAQQERGTAMRFMQELYERFSDEAAMIGLATMFMAEKEFGEAKIYLEEVIAREEMDMTYYSAVFMNTACLEHIEPDKAVAAYRNAVSLFEEAYQKNKSKVYVMAYAVECYKHLGDSENEERCRKILESLKPD